MEATLHFEKRTTLTLGDDRVTGIEFKDGSEIDGDTVVSGGFRLNADLQG